MKLRAFLLALSVAFGLGSAAIAAPHRPLVNDPTTGQTGTLQNGDTLQTPVATTANASLNVPCAAGAAPTSPNDGDVWCTSAGLFLRVGSTTVGPFAATTVLGPVFTTGSPASGNLAKFSGPTSITNGDLSGDCTTSGTLATVCIKTNGVSFGPFATGTDAANLTGTLSLSRFATQAANLVFAGPTTGSAATPTFRNLVGADLPNPSASTLGGVESIASASHKWVNTISTSGVPGLTQPACGDLSDSTSLCNSTLTASLDTLTGCSSRGSVAYRDTSTWKCLGIGTNTYVIASNGTVPEWDPAVSACENPCMIGTLDIQSGTGQPSLALPEGSVWLRTDEPQIWQQGVPAGTTPAVVQGPFVVVGTNTETLTTTPAIASYLIAYTWNKDTMPAAATGWTACTVTNCSKAASGNAPNYQWFYRQVDSTSFSTTQAPTATTATNNGYGVDMWEVSGLNPNDFNSAIQAITAGQADGAGNTLTVNYTTTSPNTLNLVATGAREQTFNTCASAFITNYGSPWTGVQRTFAAGATGEGGTQFTATTTSAVSASTTSSSCFAQPIGQTTAILSLNSPGAASWFLIGPAMSTVLNAGTQITATGTRLNCSTGTNCTVDSLGKTVTITASAVGGSSGQLQYNNAGALGGFTMAGDCTISVPTVTCLNTNGTPFGTFATANAATPPAIGGTTPAAGAFTTLSATGNLTTNVTGGGMQCVQVNSSGVVSGTGSACGSASGAAIHGTPTSGNCTSWFNSTTVQDAGSACGGGSSTIVAPQGRLTLVTGTPVMTSDQTAKSTVYYDCFTGKNVPYYNGSSDALDTVGSCEVSMTMQTSGTGVTNSGGVFDVAWDPTNHSICVVTNGSGGGWASDTSGSNTARGTGYSQVHNSRGYYTFANTTAHCYNGTTDYGSVAADQRSYLGTLYTTAAGQTGMQFAPAASGTGSNAFLALWNAYNRVPFTSVSRDNTTLWTYNSATWRPSHNSTSERISFVDGLAQSTINGEFMEHLQNGSGSNPTIGMNLDSTSNAPVIAPQQNGTGSVTAVDHWTPQVGLHFIQAMEAVADGTNNATFFGAVTSPTRGFYALRITAEF